MVKDRTLIKQARSDEMFAKMLGGSHRSASSRRTVKSGGKSQTVARRGGEHCMSFEKMWGGSRRSASPRRTVKSGGKSRAGGNVWDSIWGIASWEKVPKKGGDLTWGRYSV